MNFRSFYETHYTANLCTIVNNTIFSKKQCLVSFFRIQDPIQKESNPTQLSKVNEVITKIKKFKLVSKARQPIEYDEFIILIKYYKERSTIVNRFEAICTSSIQWYLAAKINHLMKLKFAILSSNAQNNFTLLCKMQWSKNIKDEYRDPE